MEADVSGRCALDGTQRVLKMFIDEYRSSPELWDPKNDDYSNKYRRVEAQDRLLAILKRIQSDATRIDVRKKINTFRSNYNKKAGMVKAAEAEGRVYIPKNWLYHELRFLETIKKPDTQLESHDQESEDGDCVEEVIEDITDPIKFEIAYPTAVDYVQVDHGQDLPEVEQDLLEPIQKKPKHDHNTVDSSSTVNRLRRSKVKTTRRPELSNVRSSIPSVTAIEPVALVWSSKLQTLEPTQRLYAEKAINDVLFEASLNKLQKGPMVINAGVSSVFYAEAEGVPVEVEEEYIEYGSSDEKGDA